MKKSIYEPTELEIIEFQNGDVILTSDLPYLSYEEDETSLMPGQ